MLELKFTRLIKDLFRSLYIIHSTPKNLGDNNTLFFFLYRVSIKSHPTPRISIMAQNTEKRKNSYSLIFWGIKFKQQQQRWPTLPQSGWAHTNFKILK